MTLQMIPTVNMRLKTKRFRFYMALVALGITAINSAYGQAGANCDPQSQEIPTINACAVQLFQQTDTAINILYSDVMRALSAHERPALRKDQTEWIRMRTRECKARHTHDESLSDWPAHYHRCLTNSTQSRRKQLLHWLHHGSAP